MWSYIGTGILAAWLSLPLAAQPINEQNSNTLLANTHRVETQRLAICPKSSAPLMCDKEHAELLVLAMMADGTATIVDILDMYGDDSTKTEMRAELDSLLSRLDSQLEALASKHAVGDSLGPKDTPTPKQTPPIEDETRGT